MPDTDTETPDATPAAPADQDATDTPEALAEDTTDEQHGDELGERGKAAIAAEREARKATERKLREAQTRLQESQAQLKEYEDKNKSELQKLVERVEAAELAKVEAERAKAEAEMTAMRSRVAASKGVPMSALTGTTEDELIAAADELLAWRAAQSGVKRPPASPGKSGASGNENTNPDPKTVAAQALKLLYKSG